MLNMTAVHKVATELGAHYPMNVRFMQFCHTSMFVNLLVSTLKTLLPSKIHESIRVGQTFDQSRLDELFSTPSPVAAKLRMASQLEASLRRRYDNEASFTL